MSRLRDRFLKVGYMTPISLDRAARHEKSIIQNLMQLYQYDLAPFAGDRLDQHGHYGYAYLDRYWTAEGEREGRIPFLIRVDVHLAGFILINRYSRLSPHEDSYSIAEFFVLNTFRRRGIGEAAARQVFKQVPGRWEVAVMRNNLPAISFWRFVVSLASGGDFKEIDLCSPTWDGPVFSFVSTRTGSSPAAP